MSVAVAGATGGVGKAIVERLAREGVPTRALVRDVYEAVRSTQHTQTDSAAPPSRSCAHSCVKEGHTPDLAEARTPEL